MTEFELLEQQAVRIPPPASLRDNPPYHFNHSNPNMRDQNGRPTFFRGIYCHSCREEGHYSTSCTRPVVSEAQKNADRWAIDELQGDPRQYPQGPDIVSGLPPAQSALALVASGGVKRQEQGSKKINNIRMATVVIMKLPREEEVKSDYADPIAAATKSQKLAPTKISEPKNP